MRLIFSFASCLFWRLRFSYLMRVQPSKRYQRISSDTRHSVLLVKLFKVPYYHANEFEKEVAVEKA